MKLDRNLTGNGRGKYSLIRNRRVDVLLRNARPETAAEVQAALAVLEKHDIINHGDNVDDEFFVLMLRDRFAGSALANYAVASYTFDPEYGADVMSVAARAGLGHPNHKTPD